MSGATLVSPSDGRGVATPRVLPLGHGTVVSVDARTVRARSRASVLPELVVAYRHDGLAPADGPQVVVVHALTGSADAAGDWWAPLIGPGRALDTDRYGVLCANLLGGRYGTTGPTSIDPATGAPWGAGFPQVSTRDQAAALWRLLDALGIDQVALVTGGSLGGMVALEVAVAAPGPGRPGAAHGRAGGDRADGHRLEPDPGRRSSTAWATTGWRSPVSWP